MCLRRRNLYELFSILGPQHLPVGFQCVDPLIDSSFSNELGVQEAQRGEGCYNKGNYVGKFVVLCPLSPHSFPHSWLWLCLRFNVLFVLSTQYPRAPSRPQADRNRLLSVRWIGILPFRKGFLIVSRIVH